MGNIKKNYELVNHLQNVLVTVSDKKIPVDADNDGIIDGYEAEVLTAQDYAPFGSILVGRNYNAPGAKDYSYGFNGKMNDDEVKGEGNQQDYGFRIYDPRLGRFLSVDPLTDDYPWYTPYQFAGNTPIQAIDLDGLEPAYAWWGGLKWLFSSDLDNMKGGISTIRSGASDYVNSPSNVAIDRQNVEDNPELTQYGAQAARQTNATITGINGVVQLSEGVQSAGTKVQAIAELPLIVKDLTKTAIKKGTSEAVKGGVIPEASAQATSKYKMTVDNVPGWKSTTTHSPNFIVDESGQAFPVPKGAKGPTPVVNPSGKQTGVAYTGGSGGKNGQVSTMRIMDPVPPKGKSPGYPNGYVKYENAASPKPQGVDPQSGQTLPNSQSHYPTKNKKD